MKNGDMPASALHIERGSDFYGKNKSEMYLGLTKREHFAGLAPSEIPSWFNQVFSETAKPELTWHRESTNHSIGECGWTQEGEAALYFAWRTYYADALLKELAK